MKKVISGAEEKEIQQNLTHMFNWRKKGEILIKLFQVRLEERKRVCV